MNTDLHPEEFSHASTFLPKAWSTSVAQVGVNYSWDARDRWAFELPLAPQTPVFSASTSPFFL